MHESRLVASLVARAETVVKESGASSARRIGVNVGALSGVDADVVRAQWGLFATGSTQHAELEIVIDGDPVAPHALGVTLAYVEVEG